MVGDLVARLGICPHHCRARAVPRPEWHRRCVDCAKRRGASGTHFPAGTGEEHRDGGVWRDGSHRRGRRKRDFGLAGAAYSLEVAVLFLVGCFPVGVLVSACLR